WSHLMVEAKKLAYADRMCHTADPKFLPSRIERLLDKRWAKRRYAEIDASHAATDVRAGDMQDGDTTHLAVVDANGMMVSLIQPVSAAFGCGVVAGETGIVLNNRVGRGFSLEPGHPNVFEPGKRTMHTLNCYLVGDAEGRVVLAGGTPGGDGQPQWNAQIV